MKLTRQFSNEANRTVTQIFFDPSTIGVDYVELVERADALPSPIKIGGSRLVLHIQTSPQAVEDLLALIRQLAEEKRAAGFVPTDITGKPSGNIYVRAKKPE